MKQLMMAALLLPALVACGNEPEGDDAMEAKQVEVPAAVSAAFAKQFLAATAVKWEMEDATTYEAEFKENGLERSASYGVDGSWKETETEMNPTDLPLLVQQAIATAFADHVTKEAEEVLRPSGTFYEVELKKGGHTMEVLFAADGTQVQGKAEEQEEGEEDED